MTTELGPAPEYSGPAGESRAEFWQWLVSAGYIEGDPNYYGADALKGEGEFANAIQTAIKNSPAGSGERKALVDTLYSMGVIANDTAEGRAYWTDTEADAFGADMDSLGTASEEFFKGNQNIPGDDATKNTGPYPGALQGGTLSVIQREGQEDMYVMLYEWPAGSGKYVSWQFDNAEQVDSTYGPDWRTSGVVQIGEPRSEDWFRKTATDWGTADEIIGVAGSFSGYVDDIVYEVGKASGIDDPTLLGQMLNDPEIQEIYVQNTEAGWTDQQLRAALRNTSFWTETLYPGIESFYGQTDNPEGAWKQYNANINTSLERMGVPKDADGTYKSTVSKLLTSGVSDVALNDHASTFIRAQRSEEYAQSLNKWTQSVLGRSMNGFNDWFDVLSGTASADLLEVAEVATLDYVANQMGSDISDTMISEIGANTNLSEDQARTVFSEYDRALLGLGARGLERYQLSTEDILAAKAGYQYDAQGRTIEKTNQLIQKAATELGLEDDRKAQFYTSFNERGVPVRPGLGAAAPELG